MKLLSVKRTGGRKEFTAKFEKENGKTLTRHFGTSSNYVLNKNKTKQDRENYIKRHRVNENFDDPTTAGSLSRHLLWGNSRSLNRNISDFKKRFNL